MDGEIENEPNASRDREKYDAHSTSSSENLKGKEKILAEMRNHMAEGFSHWGEVYSNADDNLKFAYVRQWDQQTLEERNENGQPTITLSMLPEHINQVVGGMEQNTYGINVIKSSGLNDEVVSSGPFAPGQEIKKYSLAEVMSGIIRDIEQRCDAESAYLAAAQMAVESGFGWLRIDIVNRRDDPFQMELEISAIMNRNAVMFDPFAAHPDKRDAMWASVSEIMSDSEFNDRYNNGKDRPSDKKGLDMPGSGQGEFLAWWNVGAKNRRVVEYWYKKKATRKAIQMVDEMGNTITFWEDEVREVLDEMKNMGLKEKQSKKFETYKVMRVKATQDRILEGPEEWPGMDIPIVGVFGRQIHMDGKTHYVGLIEYAKDPSRLINYWASAATERMGMSPKHNYVVAKEQIDGHEKEWANMNQGGGKGYLPYNYVEGLQAPRREEGANVPFGEIQFMGVAQQFVMTGTGLHQANLGQQSNERSGKAIQERAQQGMTGTHTFSKNLSKAIARAGEILCDLIPKVYTNETAQRLILPDKTTAVVELNKKIKDEETGRTFRVAPLSMARYNCTVTVSKSYDTVRQEFVEKMLDWAKNDPQGFASIRHLIFQGMDLPLADQIAEVFKKTAPPGVLSPEEQQKYGSMQPTPDQQASMLEQQARFAEANAKMKVAEAAMSTAEINTMIQELKVRIEEMELEQERLKTVQVEATSAEKISAGASNAKAAEVANQPKRPRA